MNVVFELSKPGRASSLLPECDVPTSLPNATFLRNTAPALPEVAEVDLNRHYNHLADEAFGVCDGFYPLGSCSMKYNPRINEELSALPGFSDIHPLQPENTVQGALEAMALTCDALAEITGMDAVTLQPAAGAQGEYAGLLLIRAFHKAAGDDARTKIIVPDSAHGTNPATASMAGFDTVNVASNAEGGVDLEALRAVVGPDTAGLMLTNPNTLGLFDPNILEICEIVHEAGGLCYYDGANLNPIMGIVRPGDMGFDCVHLNLHKTFSTPHGGGGPGSGPVGCKAHLQDFLPSPIVVEKDGAFAFERPRHSIGRMKSFYGNFGVAIRALAYMLALGKEGIPEAARTAVLNANYLMRKLDDLYAMPFSGPCMHEFVMDIGPLKDETGASALDVAKRFLDFGMHPPTMYFPLIVHEALMVEPTETESRETLDAAAEAFRTIWHEAHESPGVLAEAPHTTRIGRPNEVQAARSPIVRWKPESGEGE
ncbi:aminomethyl-transferring glycine dehydrogenase subunit GcvPB [Raoultibacter phocaeensis]|uniref:aminomethyl-transferring glycine dehydrogenase subunit GcvPB n=1 Tax=Raoultibacter phocaeensis TaxID=2479841 RepID=UPI001118571D|nr:aminomethyl-transferring glycine dehydrogenase subunit GcvPB [Raoultibacter phocaeensis]